MVEAPAAIETVAGATVTVVGISAATATLAVPLALPLVAVTVAVPTARPVTVVDAPLGVTATIPDGAADHVTGALVMI